MAQRRHRQLQRPPTTPSFGAGDSYGVALGDLDGDGDLDALVANSIGEAETVWRNDGTGSFSAHPTTPSFGAGISEDVALGDLDGDGDLDAVVANCCQPGRDGVAATTARAASVPTRPRPPSAPATATAWRWATWTATATSTPSSPTLSARPRRCGATTARAVSAPTRPRPPSAPATAMAWRWATWTATATSTPSSPPVVVARPRRCGSTATSRAWA